MKGTVKDRTIEFVRFKKLSMKEFEKLCGLSSGYVTSMRKGFGVDKLNNVLTAFPELNREWLLYGEGDMLRTVTQEAHGNNNTQIANSSNIGNSEVAEKALNELSEMRKLLDKAIQNNKEQAERFFEIINRLTTK